ncbi:MAG: hypothetical protein ABJJ53_12350 [Sulfitobacter sp.]
MTFNRRGHGPLHEAVGNGSDDTLAESVIDWFKESAIHKLEP